MRTTTIASFLLLLSCSSEKSNSGSGPNPIPTPVVVPPGDGSIETCLNKKTNLSSDLVALEAQMPNLKNAKDIANGIFRASCNTQNQ